MKFTPFSLTGVHHMCIEKNREKLDLGEGLGLTVHYNACAVTTTKAKMAVPSP